MIIAIDFDGTCVTHEFPKVGQDIGAAPVLRELVAAGHQLILYTMRDKATLMDAVDWFQKNEIDLWGINKNPDQTWTTSPKIFAHLYIDDAALGAPLTADATTEGRPFIDWERVREELVRREILEPAETAQEVASTPLPDFATTIMPLNNCKCPICMAAKEDAR